MVSKSGDNAERGICNDAGEDAMAVKSPEAFATPNREHVRSHCSIHQFYRGWRRWCALREERDVRRATEKGTRNHLVIHVDYAYPACSNESMSIICVTR